MIASVETRNYRCLRNISRELKPFQVLVGPDASGKTTFPDVPAFLREVLEAGPIDAVVFRTDNFADMTWARTGSSFEVAVEAAIPDSVAASMNGRGHRRIRYELSIGMCADTGETGILWENVLLLNQSLRVTYERSLFPELHPHGPSLATTRSPRGSRTVIRKVRERNDKYCSEVHTDSGKGWMPSFRLGPLESALANLPDDQTRFPATTWFRSLLRDGVQTVSPNSAAMRRPSPPGQSRGFRTDGSNMPWVIARLQAEHREQYAAWLRHVRTAMSDVLSIEVIERPEDRHRYLMVRYANGMTVPSWAVSDGTLRLFALTLLAYVAGRGGIYLVEEPENGIHPRAVETMYQALASVYDAQILVASHSPVLLANAALGDVLCFRRTEDGATDIVSGTDHPLLRKWHQSSNPGFLLASGVL